MAFILVAIPLVFAIILTVNSLRLTKKIKEYKANPANVPFQSLAALQKRIVGFLIFFAVFGFQFLGPIYSMIEEATDIMDESETDVVLILWCLAVLFFITAFILGVIALIKFGQAKKVNNQLIFKNNMTNNQGFGNNTVNNQGFGNNNGNFQVPFVQKNPNSQVNMRQQNSNGFQGAWANSSNDVPEGYEAPPDLNGYYGQNYQKPVQKYGNGVFVGQNRVLVID